MKSITVLKLKITDGVEPLEGVGRLCRLARNAAVEDWLLRQRGKPESPKQAKMRENKPLSESTKLYHACTAAAPELGTTQASMVAAHLSSYLGAKVDWRRGAGEDGKRKRRRDAVLVYEDRPPFSTSLEIPLHNSHTRVAFGDSLTITVRRPLRDLQDMVLGVSLRKLPPGIVMMLRDVCCGARKLADSELIEKDGAWYWHVPVSQETEPLSDVEAVLWPVTPEKDERGKSDRPFRLELPGRIWYVGDGRYLIAQTARLIGLRKMIGWRYRQRMGAGHGRKKVDEAVRRRRQQEWNMRAEVRRRAIADIVRQCVRHGCGRLVYREPTSPVREKCWFKCRGLDWDWTRFGADLANAAARAGVQVEVCKLRLKEVIDAAKASEA